MAETARLLSVRVKRDTGDGGPPRYVCAHGVTRQSVYRALAVAKQHGIAVSAG